MQWVFKYLIRLGCLKQRLTDYIVNFHLPMALDMHLQTSVEH